LQKDAHCKIKCITYCRFSAKGRVPAKLLFFWENSAKAATAKLNELHFVRYSVLPKKTTTAKLNVSHIADFFAKDALSKNNFITGTYQN
jgi:hypothetical protein